jgi:hypothetical protein
MVRRRGGKRMLESVVVGLVVVVGFLSLGQEVTIPSGGLVDHSGETWQFGQVRGVSFSNIGVYGWTETAEHVAVYGQNTAGTGMKGVGNGGDGVQGFTTLSTAAGVLGFSYAGTGTIGWSSGNDGLVGITTSSDPARAAIRARNEGAGPAIVCEGDLVVTGEILQSGAEEYSVEDTLDQLRSGLDAGVTCCHSVEAQIESFADWLAEVLYGGSITLLGMTWVPPDPDINLWDRITGLERRLEAVAGGEDQLLLLDGMDVSLAVLDTIDSNLVKGFADVLAGQLDIMEIEISLGRQLQAGFDESVAAFDDQNQRLSVLAEVLGNVLVGTPIALDFVNVGAFNWPPGGSLSGQLAGVETKVDGVSAQLSVLDNKVTSCGLTIVAQGQTLDDVAEALQTSTEEVQAARRAIDALGDNVASSECLLAVLESEIGDVQHDLGQLLPAVEAARSQVGSNSEALDDVVAKLVLLEERTTAHDQDLDDLRDALDTVLDHQERESLALDVLAQTLDSLSESAFRIEDQLNQQAGAPPAPDSSKIRVTIESCDLPAYDWMVLVKGDAGATVGGAWVEVYGYPGGDSLFVGRSPSFPDGSFESGKCGTLPDGETPVTDLLWVEVTQRFDADGPESARTRVMLEDDA